MVTQLTNEISRLVNDANFISKVADNCKRAGISAKEWNTNKAMILMSVAVEVVTQ